jgi:excisionase family DNA binding protein
MEQLVRVEQAAQFLGIPPRTLYHWAAKGRVPHVRLAGTGLRFQLSVLEAWVKRSAVPVGGKRRREARRK